MYSLELPCPEKNEERGREKSTDLEMGKSLGQPIEELASDRG
jgi:hypothetical protein